MALPGSGQLSFSAIANELGLSLSNLSLRSMSSTAGFTTPDAVSEFYGYSNITYTYYASYTANAPCIGNFYDIYTGSDGKYYALDGVTYVLMFSVAEYWYESLYYDPNFMADVYNVWIINSTSTVLTDDGLFLANPC